MRMDVTLLIPVLNSKMLARLHTEGMNIIEVFRKYSTLDSTEHNSSK